MKFVLILMVKNESRIIERCLSALESAVDAFCVVDTGSTDNTVALAKQWMTGRVGTVVGIPWVNFGVSRSASFTAAHAFVQTQLKWDLKDTYGLLLDADMVFHPGSLRTTPLTEIGYTIVQCAGTLEYPNCRLVRMDFPWKCVGVTHEYWDGPTSHLPKSVCWIEDRNDGGCKSDKFERDARLLERGIREEPDNVRYYFYLGQTYHSLGRFKESIAMYKKRIRLGGWFEEVWYSHYMIAQCHQSLGNIPKFEEWMLRAYAFRRERAESLYKLTKYFREHAQHHKAYQYYQMGSAIPQPGDSLFIESDVYKYLFDYERSILEYYVHPGTLDGLRASVACLLKTPAYQANILSNLVFYAKPLGTRTKLTLPSPFGPTYRTSAISLKEYPLANVRYVNYWMEGGSYKTPPGECVKTENAFVNLETGEVLATMNDASVTLPRREVHVKGLEDVRLYGSNRFTATVQEYSPEVRVLDGVYDTTTGEYRDCAILPSPQGRGCEKNWLPIADTGLMIYDWHPFQVIGTKSYTHQTPPMFSLFRGSAPPVRRGHEWWALVHMVEYTTPRRYYHCFVALDLDYKPTRITLPFVFESASVEYCVSFRFVDATVECYVSFMDADSSRVVIPLRDLEWVSVEVR